MELHEILDLRIDALTSDARGVGRAGGLAVFADGALPGDTVRVRITRIARRHAEAECLEILHPSEDRIDPPCAVAGPCGGCDLQHLAYPAQARWKRQRILEDLVRIGGFPREEIQRRISDILVPDNLFRSRNNVQMPVGGTAEHPQIGFFAKGSHTVVDSTECIVSPRAADLARECLRAAIAAFGSAPRDEADTSVQGLVRELTVRTGTATGQAMAVLTLTGRNTFLTDAFRRALDDTLTREGLTLASFGVRIVPLGAQDRSDVRTECIFGRETIEEIVCGLRFRISPDSFFQVNTAMAERLFGEILRLADPADDDRIFDLYCGTGSISLILAGHCREVTGIEIGRQAILDAEANAALNSIHNASFIAGKAESILPDLASHGARADAVVLDPPRKGADRAVLDAIIAIAPSRIVYVSCDPATLARDCRILCAGGTYGIRAVTPVDLFPWTKHVETVVLMSRDEAGKA